VLIGKGVLCTGQNIMMPIVSIPCCANEEQLVHRSKVSALLIIWLFDSDHSGATEVSWAH